MESNPTTGDVLLEWFEKTRRIVAGRDESDSYRVWVAEVMAQQTRMTTVAEYYQPFLNRFPTVTDLAAAPLDEVLRLWAGLGYYARARNLHAAAREVVAGYGGSLPADVDELRSLPGIGKYTAGAIASLAFGLAEPAVDGNVRRVMARVWDDPDPSASTLASRVKELIRDTGDAASVNQALMDLGASVCKPRSPLCPDCPLRIVCRARRRGTVDQRPAKRSRKPLPHYDVAVACVWKAERLLIARRPESSMLGGLWEFPGGKIEPGESAPDAARREVREEMEIDIDIGPPAAVVKHTYSHFGVTLHAYHARHLRGTPRPESGAPWAWARKAELVGYAFPAASVRIIESLPETYPEDLPD